MANQPPRYGLVANRRSSSTNLKEGADGATLLKRTCQICGKVVCRASDLSRHMLIHTGIKEHVCPQCDKAFTQKSALKTHLNTHTGATPYACEYCHKAFRDPSVRTRHIEEQHLQKKMLYECSICVEREGGDSAKYRRRDVLRRHLKTKHGITTLTASPAGQRIGPANRKASRRGGAVAPQAHRKHSVMLNGGDPVIQKAQLNQFRPTRRAAIRATEMLASIIQKEAESLTVLPDEDDVDYAELAPLPIGVPIFAPSYTPSVPTKATSLFPTKHVGQRSTRELPRHAMVENRDTPLSIPFPANSTTYEVSPRDCSFTAVEPSHGTPYSSFNVYLKEHRRRCSSLYLVSPVTSPTSHYFGPQGSSHFIQDRIPSSPHPALCINPSVLQDSEHDYRTLFNHDFTLRLADLQNGSRSSVCEAF